MNAQEYFTLLLGGYDTITVFLEENSTLTEFVFKIEERLRRSTTA